MELRAIRLTTTVPVEPSALYAAWLDSDAHSAFTGAPALIDPREGGKYQAWGDYIQGTVVALHEGASVVQTWRASEFPADAVDSLVEVTFAADGKGGTLLTLVHTGLPADLASQYEHGWDEYYFKPMRAYFRLQRDRAVANKRLAASLAAAKKAVVKKPAAKKPAAKKPAAKKPAAKKPAAKKPAAKKPAAKKPAAKKTGAKP